MSDKRREIPSARPPTKAECWDVARWTYPKRSQEEQVYAAIDLYVAVYRRWVNERGWRKPLEWTHGRVPLRMVRKGAMSQEEAQRLRQQLRADWRAREAAAQHGG